MIQETETKEKKPFYFPLYTADWLEGTKGMSTEEKGAYMELLIYQFGHGSIPIKDTDRIQRIAGTKNDLVFVLEKFPNGKNKKMSCVIKNLMEKSRQAREAANARWECDRTTGAMLSKDKAKDKEKNVVKDTAVAVTATTPQAKFVETWADIYKKVTGHEYIANKEDYILVAQHMKKITPDQMIVKARILFKSCNGGQKLWFAKGMGDFTIKKLISKWNEIVETKTKSESAMDSALAKMEDKK